MNKTDYKTIGCREPIDKIRSTTEQKNLIVRIKRWVILKLKRSRR